MKYSEIDMEIEKNNFLFYAFESDVAIYELIWELEKYALNIEDKYKVAREILTSLSKNNCIVLEKYKDLYTNDCIEIISSDKITEILNNAGSWYPCNEIYRVSLTEKGMELNKLVNLKG